MFHIAINTTKKIDFALRIVTNLHHASNNQNIKTVH